MDSECEEFDAVSKLHRAESVFGRRQFLGTAASLMAGTGLWSNLQLLADDAKRSGRACIMVWLGGAPSQLETWDPKPGTANGGETKAISTKTAGVRIADFWPALAERSNDFSILRTIVGKEAAHERGTYHLHTGRRMTGTSRFPCLGSVAAHELGDPKSDLPNFVSIGKTLSAGFLGISYAPFEVNRPGELPDNVTPIVNDARLRKRLNLLEQQNSDFTEAGAAALVTERRTLYDRAKRLMESPRLKAFDFSSESEKMKSAYGGSRFGQGLLVARRLIEAGVPFVEVARGGWDMHTDLTNRMKNAAPEVDQGLGQLFDDLKQRGMMERTVVICLGEFGRTPKLNSRGSKPGRDHWARNFGAILGGGSIRSGRVVGKTSDNGQEISDRPISVEDLFQTICRAMEIDANKELYTPEGRPLKLVDGGQPIQELFA